MRERYAIIEERELESWLTLLRLTAALFIVVELAAQVHRLPPGHEKAGWAVTGVFLAGALGLFAVSRRMPPRWESAVGLASLVFDTSVIIAYWAVFSTNAADQARWGLVLVVVEAALRYGPLGGVVMPIVLLPFLVYGEWWRADHFGLPGFSVNRVVAPTVVLLLTGIVLGERGRRLRAEVQVGLARADEAEALRDELGRHVDALEAANRCARALGSSLEMEDAFSAFIKELQRVVPFDRMAIVLVENGEAATMATAGRGAGEVFPPGSVGPLAGSVLERVLEGRTLVRHDLAETEYPEDRLLVALGLHSELVAPLPVGARPIGMLSISRKATDAFSGEEVELVSLLGRLVATAVQNIRAYDAERRRVEELNRLSALRADFVSLVSHELRSPMAAVIGAARTLQARRHELTLEQRESFLALIANETSRLAAFIGDVLDTSRIEAGTFGYSFGEVDLTRLIDEVVAVASVGQDDVAVRVTVSDRLPSVHGDPDRLRQVLSNLVDNAVKYSESGDEVEVTARADNGVVLVRVSDHGPGIPRDQQRLIFEKFGRATGQRSPKAGTGLGLFIARSIVEAHGGSLEVESLPERGATFTLTLRAVA